MILEMLNLIKFKITNIIPNTPEDGSLEPKRYSVDFAFE